MTSQLFLLLCWASGLCLLLGIPAWIIEEAIPWARERAKQRRFAATPAPRGGEAQG